MKDGHGQHLLTFVKESLRLGVGWRMYLELHSGNKSVAGRQLEIKLVKHQHCFVRIIPACEYVCFSKLQYL